MRIFEENAYIRGKCVYLRKMRIFEQFKLYNLSSVGAISMGLISGTFQTFSEKNY